MSTRLISLLFLLLVVAACGGDDDVPADGGSDPTATLAGTSWEARDVFVAGTSVDLVPRSRITLVFREDGTAGGTTGCNGYSSDVSISGDRITFGLMGMTEMACEPPLMEQEARVVAILQSADRWSLADGVLSIGAGDGSGGIDFVAPVIVDADVAATQWILDTVVDGDAASTPLQGTEPTLRLNPASGEINGTTGCNDFTGEIAVAAPAFSVENLAWTERGCAPDVMAQESALLEALLAADTIEVAGDRLTLSAPDGTALVYRAG